MAMIARRASAPGEVNDSIARTRPTHALALHTALAMKTRGSAPATRRTNMGPETRVSCTSTVLVTMSLAGIATGMADASTAQASAHAIRTTLAWIAVRKNVLVEHRLFCTKAMTTKFVVAMVCAKQRVVNADAMPPTQAQSVWNALALRIAMVTGHAVPTLAPASVIMATTQTCARRVTAPEVVADLLASATPAVAAVCATMASLALSVSRPRAATCRTPHTSSGPCSAQGGRRARKGGS